jgi:hypothetical protein
MSAGPQGAGASHDLAPGRVSNPWFKMLLLPVFS